MLRDGGVSRTATVAPSGEDMIAWGVAVQGGKRTAPTRATSAGWRLRAPGAAAHSGRLEERQQHRKLLGRFDGMGRVGRHVYEIAGLEGVQFAAEQELALARQNLDEGVLGGGVLRQFLPLGEAEQHYAGGRRAQQGPADNAVGGELGFVGQGEDFGLLDIDHWLFIHTGNMPWKGRGRIDENQFFLAASGMVLLGMIYE